MHLHWVCICIAPCRRGTIKADVCYQRHVAHCLRREEHVSSLHPNPNPNPYPNPNPNPNPNQVSFLQRALTLSR